MPPKIRQWKAPETEKHISRGGAKTRRRRGWGWWGGRRPRKGGSKLTGQQLGLWLFKDDRCPNSRPTTVVKRLEVLQHFSRAVPPHNVERLGVGGIQLGPDARHKLIVFGRERVSRVGSSEKELLPGRKRRDSARARGEGLVVER